MKSSPYKDTHEIMTAKQNTNNRHLKLFCYADQIIGFCLPDSRK